MLDGLSQLLLLGICGALLAFAFFVESREERATFFSPLVFLVSVLVFAYGVRSILTFNDISRYGAFTDYYNASDLPTFVAAYLLFVVGTIALILGYASRGYTLINPILPALHITSTRKLFLLSVLLLSMGIGVFLLLLPALLAAGAVFGLFERDTRMAVGKVWEGRGPLLFLLMQSGLFFTCLLYALKMRGFTFFTVLISVLLGLVIAVAFAFIGSRQGLIGIFIMAVLFFHYRVRHVPVGVQAVFGLATILAGGILGQALDGSLQRETTISIVEVLANAFVRFTGTFDQFEMLSAYIQKSEHFFFGATFLEDIVWTYTPRGIFPFKPEVYGALRLQDALLPHLYDLAGTTATYPIGFFGEAYANLHLAGVVIFPFLFGCLLRAIVQRSRTEGASSLYPVVIIAVLASGPGLARAIGGTVLLIILTVLMLKMLFCVYLVVPRTQSSR